ncbi:MAG: hypothetical protein AAF206_03875 [Bacteroidota bacterium]
MHRRNFLKKAGLATAATIGMPYILPSGRLFAQTTSRMANHVVLVMFAGGVRMQESIGMQYLDGTQNEAIAGNIMYNMLDGTPPDDKIVYGTSGSRPGEIPIPAILNTPLQRQGTTFREMQASLVGHFGGLNVALQGNTLLAQGLRQSPLHPTIFEYLRRHAGIPATKCWFVGNGIGGSIPLLNHSVHPDYGPQYAANFIAPSVTFGQEGFDHLSNAKNYHPEFELDPMYKMKLFLDNSFQRAAQTIAGIGNTAEEKWEIKQFITEMFDKTENDSVIQSPEIGLQGDLLTVGYACEVMKRFKPNLTVVNFNNVDSCHASFTGYLRALHRADHGVGFLWDYIQREIPEMANDTIMMVMPECGRNLDPNPIRDENNWFGFDHNDAHSRRIFGMMVGPNVPQDLAVGNENNPVGISADAALTIAHIMGIRDQVGNAGLVNSNSRSLFDRI